MTLERTKVNYKPLWKLLIDRELSKSELQKKSTISRSTMLKMSNNEYVAMDVLVRICVALDCTLDDIVEIEKRDKEEN
ncbi:MAG: helix-turn-helix transcriptional regulator [Eubacteriales bacterium]|nr:helix-turn-helix transcriptional regulator [Eubacteriales bacterium]